MYDNFKLDMDQIVWVHNIQYFATYSYESRKMYTSGYPLF